MSEKLFGSTNNPTISSSKGYIRLNSYTCTVDGTCNSVKYKAGANGNVRVAVYGQTAGEPYTLLAESASTAVTAGWNTITLSSSFAVTNGTVYWCACQEDTDNVVTYVSSAGAFIYRYKASTYEAFPNPITGLTSSTDYEISGMQGWGDSGTTKNSGDNGSGTETVTARTLENTEQGSGMEAGLAEAFLSAGDTGSSNESGNATGGTGEYQSSADSGSGTDITKLMLRKAGTDLKLRGQRGQVPLPNKEVSL